MLAVFYLLFTTAVATEPLQLLLLLDISGGYSFSSEYVKALESLINLVSDAHPGAEFGVADFTDKPNVASGIGSFGGYPKDYTEDWCYKSWLPFTTEPSTISNLLPNLPPGSGLDTMEGHFEALMRAVYDEQVGWRDECRKVVMMLTDSYGHSQALDTLSDHVNAYNAPVRCVGDTSVGGFGALKPNATLGAWAVSTDGKYDLYLEMAQLLWEQMCRAGTPLTAQQRSRLDFLKGLFSPISVPSVKPFDLEVLIQAPEEHCRFHEYPSYEDVINAYTSQHTELIVLFYGSDSTTWDWVVTDSVAGLGRLNATLISTADLPSPEIAQALLLALDASH